MPNTSPDPTAADDQQTRNPTRWVGLSADDRRADRRELPSDRRRLRAARHRGLGGHHGASTLCQAARLNPRYFYEGFEDLDGLVVAVYDWLVAQLGEEVMAASSRPATTPGPRPERGELASSPSWTRTARRAQVLYVEALGNEALNRRRLEVTAHQLVTAVELAAVELPRPARAGGGAHRGRIGAPVCSRRAAELIVAWLDGPPPITVSREQLVDDATEIFFAIGPRPPPALATTRFR